MPFVLLAAYEEQINGIYTIVKLSAAAMGTVAVAFGAYRIIFGGDEGFKKGIAICVTAILAVIAIYLLPSAINIGVKMGQKYAWDPANPQTMGETAKMDGQEFDISKADEFSSQQSYTYNTSPPSEEDKQEAGLTEAGDQNSGSYYKEEILEVFDELGVILDKEVNWDKLTITLTSNGYFNAEWEFSNGDRERHGDFRQIREIAASFLSDIFVRQERVAHYESVTNDTINQIIKQYKEKHGKTLTFHYDITNFIIYDGTSRFRTRNGFSYYNGWENKVQIDSDLENGSWFYFNQTYKLSEVDKIIDIIDRIAGGCYPVYTED